MDRAADKQRDLATAQSVLQGKIKTGDFDVFLCHNNMDKAAVKKIGEQLKERGILPWLDQWELRPGKTWQRLLAKRIGQIKSAAVFVGKDGVGPWQQEELESFLSEFVRRGCSVIPVLLTSGASLQRKLRNTHFERISIRMQMMKECEQDIEHGDERSQACLNVRPEPMMDALETADDGYHRQSRFDTHALIPGAFGTQFAVVGNTLGTAEAIISQHNALPVHLLNQGMKALIVDIHGVPIPGNDFALVIEQPAQFDADTPATFLLPLLAYLLWATSLANGKEQFHRITVDHGKETGLLQQALPPVLVRFEQALQAGAIGQPCKQVGIVALEPAIKSAKIVAVQGNQDANRHQFAGREFGLTVLEHVFHLIIDKAKNVDDNVFGCHEGLHSSESVLRLSLERSS